MPQSLTDILIIIAAVFLLWLVIRLFRKPIRWILKLLLIPLKCSFIRRVLEPFTCSLRTMQERLPQCSMYRMKP